MLKPRYRTSLGADKPGLVVNQSANPTQIAEFLLPRGLLSSDAIRTERIGDVGGFLVYLSSGVSCWRSSAPMRRCLIETRTIGFVEYPSVDTIGDVGYRKLLVVSLPFW